MGKKNSEHLSYDKAMDELQNILETMQSGKCGVDELATYLQRAKELADFCKDRLRTIEKDVDRFKKSLES